MNFFADFGETKAEALHQLLPAVDRMLRAHQDGDYQAFAAVATPELLEKVSEQGFQRAHREVASGLGALQSRTFLGALNRAGNPMLLLSARYAGTEDDVLVKVIFGAGTRPPLIDWVWIE